MGRAPADSILHEYLQLCPAPLLATEYFSINTHPSNSGPLLLSGLLVSHTQPVSNDEVSNCWLSEAVVKVHLHQGRSFSGEEMYLKRHRGIKSILHLAATAHMCRQFSRVPHNTRNEVIFAQDVCSYTYLPLFPYKGLPTTANTGRLLIGIRSMDE